MQYIKADTNTEVLIGPVIAVGDGFTPVTTLSLSTADEAELIKYGGSTPLTVTSISANGFAAITGADGYYTLDISTGNSDTAGFLTALINDDSLCLPVRVDFMVVNANVYDSLFAAAATDYLQTDVAQWLGTAAATPTVAGVPEVDATHFGGTAGTFSAGRAEVNTSHVSGTAQTANDNGADINTILSRVIGTILTGNHNPQGGDNYARLGAPAGASVSADIATRMAEASINTTGGAVDNVTTVATTTTNTDMRGTDSAAVASVCTEARLSELDQATAGKMANQADIIQTNTTTDIPALITALNDLAAADVLTQVNAALDTAISELGVAAPAVTPTLRTGLMLIYMMARNRVDVDTTGIDAIKIYNNAGAQIASKAITDDGTDYSEAKMS